MKVKAHLIMADGSNRLLKKSICFVVYVARNSGVQTLVRLIPRSPIPTGASHLELFEHPERFRVFQQPAKYPSSFERGFSLVELLIAMALTGAVMAGIFAIYNAQHRTTHIEAEVVDVQQNMRMGLEFVLKDLRGSGFLISGSNPVNAVGNDSGLGATDTLTLNTSSATGAVARVDATLTTNVSSGVPITLTVSSGDEADLFNAGDVVRIVDPGERAEPISGAFTVSSKSTSPATLTLTPSASGSAIMFRRGDIIARTGLSAPDTFPNTLLYCLGPAAGCAPSVTSCPAGQRCLMRIVNGSPDDDSVVAVNVQSLQFRYVSDGSSAESDAPADLSAVRAVRVNMTGQTYQTAGLSGTAKTRDLTAIARIRNR